MAKIDFDKLPRFSELPAKQGAPEGSTWGVFGDDYELGCLNFLTPEGVVEAARLVQKGKVFRLDMKVGYGEPTLFGRAVVRHKIIRHAGPDGKYGDMTTCWTTSTLRKGANGTDWRTWPIRAMGSTMA